MYRALHAPGVLQKRQSVTASTAVSQQSTAPSTVGNLLDDLIRRVDDKALLSSPSSRRRGAPGAKAARRATHRPSKHQGRQLGAQLPLILGTALHKQSRFNAKESGPSEEAADKNSAELPRTPKAAGRSGSSSKAPGSSAKKPTGVRISASDLGIASPTGMSKTDAQAAEKRSAQKRTKQRRSRRQRRADKFAGGQKPCRLLRHASHAVLEDAVKSIVRLRHHFSKEAMANEALRGVTEANFVGNMPLIGAMVAVLQVSRGVQSSEVIDAVSSLLHDGGKRSISTCGIRWQGLGVVVDQSLDRIGVYGCSSEAQSRRWGGCTHLQRATATGGIGGGKNVVDDDDGLLFVEDTAAGPGPEAVNPTSGANKDVGGEASECDLELRTLRELCDKSGGGSARYVRLCRPRASADDVAFAKGSCWAAVVLQGAASTPALGPILWL